jgi:hypothetical protein
MKEKRASKKSIFTVRNKRRCRKLANAWPRKDGSSKKRDPFSAVRSAERNWKESSFEKLRSIAVPVAGECG